MSVNYCFDCLERMDNCVCGNPSDKEIFGDIRQAYVRGYRDAKEGKEMDI